MVDVVAVCVVSRFGGVGKSRSIYQLRLWKMRRKNHRVSAVALSNNIGDLLADLPMTVVEEGVGAIVVERNR